MLDDGLTLDGMHTVEMMLRIEMRGYKSAERQLPKEKNVV